MITIITTIMILFMSIGYSILKFKNQNIQTEKRTDKLTMGLTKLIMLAPFIVTPIFIILFLTVLKGRFIERSSHALIVFILWIYATSFYVELLKYIKNKAIFLSSLIGVFIAVSTAITLTPLNRYCEILYSKLHLLNYLLGVFLVLVLYISNLIFMTFKGTVKSFSNIKCN